jgi:hypothetical protein
MDAGMQDKIIGAAFSHFDKDKSGFLEGHEVYAVVEHTVAKLGRWLVSPRACSSWQHLQQVAASAAAGSRQAGGSSQPVATSQQQRACLKCSTNCIHMTAGMQGHSQPPPACLPTSHQPEAVAAGTPCCSAVHHVCAACLVVVNPQLPRPFIPTLSSDLPPLLCQLNRPPLQHALTSSPTT